MSTTMNRSICNFCYCVFFLAVAIRTAVGQAPAAAPALPPTPPAPVPAVPTLPPPAPVLALPPNAPAPAPTGPPNVTAILEKGGHFSTLIKLITSSPIAAQLTSELNNTNNRMTILAPTDAAFSVLRSGTLNGLTEEEKTRLIHFHMIPSYISLAQFQTVSNPVSTQAGGIGKYAYPLNVTTFNNTVTLSTGIDNTTVAGTLYTDGQLAVYQLNKVLLPLGIFGPKPPAPVPAPAIPKKEKTFAPTALSIDTSGHMGLRENAVVALVSAAVAALWL